MPIMLAIASAGHHGGALAGVQPAFELAQDFLDATGQGHQLLIVARAVKRFHPIPDYTCAVLSDVSGRPVEWSQAERSSRSLNRRTDSLPDAPRACCQAIQAAAARV